MATRGGERPIVHSVRAAVVLACAMTAAVGLVALVHDRARPFIEASQRAGQLRQLTTILGELAYDNDPLTDSVPLQDPECLGTNEPLPAHRARLGGKPVALLVHVVAPDGYSASLRLLVAIDPDGKVLGVRVLEHRETPGLGDFVEARRSDWIRRFVGRSLADPPAARWRVRKDGGDFDQFTGATVTSRAVTGAVRNALTCFARHRTELLAPASPPDAP